MPRGIALRISDNDLRQAVEAATSWRGVMRELGYATTNGRTAVILRHRAEQLGLNTGHFRGKRSWSDAELRGAIESAADWGSVMRVLGLGAGGGRSIVDVKSRAVQLGVDYSHIEHRRKAPRGRVPFTAPPLVEHLRRAAPTLAAGWFAHRGYRVSFPAEPCPYDLVVDADGGLYRVQVKTATARDRKSGVWSCRLAQNPRYRKTVVYDPDDVDFFFIIDGDLAYYLVPSEEVAGLGSVSLATLEHRKVTGDKAA